MRDFKITAESSTESILGLVGAAINKQQTKYIVLGFADNVSDSFQEKIVQAIKRQFDVFVILKTKLPEQEKNLEKYFSYGVHGLYFDSKPNLQSPSEQKALTFAVELFTRGWIFAKTQNSESMIKALLELKIVPIPAEHDGRLVNYIRSHKYFHRIASNLIKTVPLLEPKQADYSLMDRIKMKLLLEAMNLRQKLMVKNADEVLGYSGL